MPRQKLQVSDVSFGTIPFGELQEELLQLLQPYLWGEHDSPSRPRMQIPASSDPGLLRMPGRLPAQGPVEDERPVKDEQA